MKKLYIALVLTFFVLPIFAQNIPSYVPKDGLVGWWPFNGNANDESGNGRNGKNNQVVESADRFGNEKSSYYFDGTSSYIEVSNSSNIELGGNDFTISVWVNNASNLDTYGHNLISKSINTLIVGSEDMWSSGLPNTKVNYGVGFDTYGKNYGIYPDILPKTGWNHIVCSKSSSGYNFYINGQKYSLPYNNNNISKSDINNGLFFGKRVGGYLGKNFSGNLDDIAIHNRTLTDAEIQVLYKGNTCPLKAAISPQGSIKICEGSSIVLQSADSTHALQWFKDNQPIVGATSKSFTATKAGQYTLKVSDLTCSTMSSATTIDTIPLPAAPALSNTYQKVCQMEPIEIISKRLTNYNSAVRLRWYRNETGNDSINQYLVLDPYPRKYYVSQLSATSPQCESPKRTMVFIDVSMPASINVKGNTTFCKGDSVVLEAFASGNLYDYTWKKDFNWIEGTEGKNTFVAKEAGRYSYQNRMCGMQMNETEIEVVVKQGLTVNVGKITGSSVEFVWDTLSLSPRPKDFVINYGINSTSLTQTISLPGGTSYTFTGLNKGDTVRVSISPKGTDCTTPSFASAVATEIVIPSNIPTNGLVGYWPFNGNANDESGHGNHGTVNGAILTADRNGKPNSAYSFDGANTSKITVSDNLSIRPQNFTIIAWISVSNSTMWNNVLSKRINSNNTNSYSLFEGGENLGEQKNYETYDVITNLNGTQITTLDLSQNNVGIQLNSWNLLIGSYDGNYLRFYINGELIRIKSATGKIQYSDDPLFIGTCGFQGDGQNFIGKIDDICLYNRALSEQEIKQLYGVGCPKETATSSSFNYPAFTTSVPLLLNAEPKGGTFKGVAIENNQFIPNKAKIGLNIVKYNFKNSQGCNDSTLFSMIVADTVGAKCTKIDTVIVKNNVYDTIKVTKFDTIIIKNNVFDTVIIKNNVFDTVTITNNVIKYDTVKVTKYDTITVTNNVTKYDTVKVTKYDTITVNNNVYDTVTITNNVTKYDTITLTDTVSILKIKFKLTTGIQANQMASMSVYPNPTTDVLHIEVGDAKALDGYRYRILDVLGKEVYNELVKNTITEIPLKTLGAAGLYQLEVLDSNKTSVQTNKIVLQ